MKTTSRLIIFLTLSISYCKSYSQWDCITSKAKIRYVHTFTKKCIHSFSNEGSEGKPFILDTTFSSKKFITITIDTILKLRGNDRSIIGISPCLNKFLMAKEYYIQQDSLKRDIKSNEDFIRHIRYLGIPITERLMNNDTSDISQDQATILYKIKNHYFSLTVPKDYMETFIRNSTQLGKLDSALLDAIRKDGGLPNSYSENKPIFINNTTYPIYKFLVLKPTNGNKDREEQEVLRYTKQKYIRDNPNPTTDIYYAKDERKRNNLTYSEAGLSRNYGIYYITCSDSQMERKHNSDEIFELIITSNFTLVDIQ